LKDILFKNSGYVHLSSSDLLRDEAAKPDSSLGKEINENIKNGSLVSTEVTRKFLIDAFQRNKQNIDGWQKDMGDKANI